MFAKALEYYCVPVSPTIVIADLALSIDEACSTLAYYPRKTLRCYDLPGPGDPNQLTRRELIRTRVINSRISNAELEWFVERAGRAPWPEPTADLRHADPAVSGGLYDKLAQLYKHFDSAAPPGIAMAKISKVLHLKRPHAIPILDRRLTSRYRHAAAQKASQYSRRGYTRMYWAAIRADLTANTESGALSALRGALLWSPPLHDFTQVSDLRLLDMLTWR